MRKTICGTLSFSLAMEGTLGDINELIKGASTVIPPRAEITVC